MNLSQLDTKQLQKAIALYYDGKSAPVVTAKGEGSIADEMIEIAREYGVPLCDNSDLVNLLINLELGDSIPESLYISIAYIIAFAYDLQGKTPQSSAQ